MADEDEEKPRTAHPAAGWIKTVPVEQTSPDKYYFVAIPNGMSGYRFWSTYLSGKENWSVKPGIANQYQGGAQLVRFFGQNAHAGLVAIEVPADADKRWKARKPPRRR